MNYLLDTHLLLWWMIDSERLTPKAMNLLSDERLDIAYSAVNTWEIGIKYAIGRLELPDNFLDLVAGTRFSSLPVSVTHSWCVTRLPLIHKDPFDRLLVAQAQSESRTLLTVDEALLRYGAMVELA